LPRKASVTLSPSTVDRTSNTITRNSKHLAPMNMSALALTLVGVLHMKPTCYAENTQSNASQVAQKARATVFPSAVHNWQHLRTLNATSRASYSVPMHLSALY
jgi:hypothetical protein